MSTENNLMQAGETKVRYLRILIDADSPAYEVLQSLEEIGYKFERPENLENIKTILVNGNEVTIYPEVKESPDESFTDMTLISLIKLKMKVWSDVSFPGQVL